MKSTIIFIALFLITLTAKSDWVKSGELDSLYLGDAPITFSKYSPDYTKFVTYSAQDSTLRLWDLGTGTVIKERTFEWSYKFDVCEFDFDFEKFYMVKNIGKLYPGSLENYAPDYSCSNQVNRMWKVGFNDTISTIIIGECQTDFEGDGNAYRANFRTYLCNKLMVGKNNIQLYYSVVNKTINEYYGQLTRSTGYTFCSSILKKDKNKVIMIKLKNFLQKTI